MATEREYDPPAMTDQERREKRMYEAYFAFETQRWIADSICADKDEEPS